MSIRLPKYARKPYDNRGEVKATDRGWVVVLPSGKEEVLWCVKGLKSKLEALQKKFDIDLQDAVDIKNKAEGDLSMSEKDKEELDESMLAKIKKKLAPKKKTKKSKKDK